MNARQWDHSDFGTLYFEHCNGGALPYRIAPLNLVGLYFLPGLTGEAAEILAP